MVINLSFYFQYFWPTKIRHGPLGHYKLHYALKLYLLTGFNSVCKLNCYVFLSNRNLAATTTANQPEGPLASQFLCHNNGLYIPDNWSALSDQPGSQILGWQQTTSSRPQFIPPKHAWKMTNILVLHLKLINVYLLNVLAIIYLVIQAYVREHLGSLHSMDPFFFF